MKLSGKMCFKIILKVTKNQGLTLSLEDTIFERPQGAGSQLTPPPAAVLRLRPQGTHFFFLMTPPFQNLGLKVVPH